MLHWWSLSLTLTTSATLTAHCSLRYTHTQFCQVRTPETSAEQKVKVQGEECVHSDSRHLKAKVKTQSAMWQHIGDDGATIPPASKQASYSLTTTTTLWHRCTLSSGSRRRGGAGREELDGLVHRYESSRSFVPFLIVCNQTGDKNAICSQTPSDVAARFYLPQGSKGHHRGIGS